MLINGIQKKDTNTQRKNIIHNFKALIWKTANSKLCVITASNLVTMCSNFSPKSLNRTQPPSIVRRTTHPSEDLTCNDCSVQNYRFQKNYADNQSVDSQNCVY